MRPGIIVLVVCAASIAVSASRPATAQEPVDSDVAGQATASPPGTAGPATLTPKATVTLIPEPTPFPDDTAIPPTPPLPTATPLLPEEGGPAGGVLGGHTYVDTDGDRTRSAGDGVSGGTIIVELIGSGGEAADRRSAVTDVTGGWQVRSLPDGTYRVLWEPPVPPELYAETIPPAEPIALSPITTVYRVIASVEISGANRVLDIDFGVPHQPPVAGAAQLPSAGQGGESDVIPTGLLALVLMGAAALGLCIAIRRTA
jgi:hypothetical protein